MKNTNNLSIQGVIRQVRALGLTCSHRAGEFRIDYRYGDVRKSAASAYFTPDRIDALGTAKIMAEWKRGEF